MSGVGVSLLEEATAKLARAEVAYQREGDNDGADAAHRLWVQARASHPRVQQHVLMQLPGPDETRVRPDDLIAVLAYPSDVIYRTLEELRWPGRKVTQSGGWWRLRA